MVTHDRYFLDNVTGWILELDRGKGIPYEGNYSLLSRCQKRKRMEQEERAKKARPPESKWPSELEWIRQGAQSPPGQKQGPRISRLRNHWWPRSKSATNRWALPQIVIPARSAFG